MVIDGNASSGAIKGRIFRASEEYIYTRRIGTESDKHLVIFDLTLSTWHRTLNGSLQDALTKNVMIFSPVANVEIAMHCMSVKNTGATRQDLEQMTQLLR